VSRVAPPTKQERILSRHRNDLKNLDAPARLAARRAKVRQPTKIEGEVQPITKAQLPTKLNDLTEQLERVKQIAAQLERRR
jgi:hypothetical protein